MTAYYFGCWKEAGHFFWVPGMRHLPRSVGRWYPDTPWENQIDGKLTPGKRGHNGRLISHRPPPPQSQAALHHKDGWTALAMHDYSVDSRGASNAAFFFDEILDAGEACAKAAFTFPEVWARIEKAKAVIVVEGE